MDRLGAAILSGVGRVAVGWLAALSLSAITMSVVAVVDRLRDATTPHAADVRRPPIVSGRGRLLAAIDRMLPRLAIAPTAGPARAPPTLGFPFDPAAPFRR